MSDDDRTQPPSGGAFPPPPPGDEPRSDPGGGSLVWGLVLGFAATAVGIFTPLIYDIYDPANYEGLWALWLVPIVLVVGVGLTVARSTRRIGGGLLLGWAVGLVVSAGVCFSLLGNPLGI